MAQVEGRGSSPRFLPDPPSHFCSRLPPVGEGDRRSGSVPRCPMRWSGLDQSDLLLRKHRPPWRSRALQRVGCRSLGSTCLKRCCCATCWLLQFRQQRFLSERSPVECAAGLAGLTLRLRSLSDPDEL